MYGGEVVLGVLLLVLWILLLDCIYVFVLEVFWEVEEDFFECVYV